MKSTIFFSFFILMLTNPLMGNEYHVGPLQTFVNINDVPWESMSAGDKVYIYYRTPAQGGDYHEKWVINVQGTALQPFSVIGVLGPNGERPVINGDGATTRTQLNYWNEERSVIKVGGSSVPSDGIPSYIVIENLEIRSGHKSYNFMDDNGNPGTYVNNAASIHVEKVDNLIIRNCAIHDSGNGIFIASNSNDITIEYNYIYGNGNVGRFFEHNTYTEATNITYQFNRFGPLRAGADGNNLKDRSAGLVVSYNWIEGGNRLMDLVDTGSSSILSNPDYRKTFVYGNILIEEDGGNSQVMHYGGDSGTTSQYRKGMLYFYNNTLYSIRSGNTTLARLSTNDESADFRNNILHVTAAGGSLALLDDSGIGTIKNNIMKAGWVNSHQGGGFSGTINNDGSSIETNDPGFNNGPAYDFSLIPLSPAIDAASVLHPDVIGSYGVDNEYIKHQQGQLRIINGDMDIGGFESDAALPVELLYPFKAKLIRGTVELSWTTALEYKTDHFMVSRNSEQGWLEVTPKGGGTNYTYKVFDNSPFPRINSYTLYEVDEDGNITMLGSARVDLNLTDITVYPNPASNIIFLSDTVEDDNPRYIIYDIKGKLKTIGIYSKEGINLSQFPAGQYFLKVELDSQLVTFQVLKQ